MHLPINQSMTRKQKATAACLNRIGYLIPQASSHELLYIYSQLKDVNWLWGVVSAAYQDRQSIQGRWLLRIAAAFWSAGIRPDQIGRNVAMFVNNVATLAGAHRALLKWSLPTTETVHRMWLFDYRRSDIKSCLEHVSKLLSKDELQCIYKADVAVYCAREEGNYRSVGDLIRYLDEFCLVPEDLGLTAEVLANWRRQQLVEQARVKFSLCRPMEIDGRIVDPNIEDIRSNIYGGVSALTQGVTLEEAGITLAELDAIRWKLERQFRRQWRNGDPSGFMPTVMPMIFEVLERERQLV